MNDFIVGAGIGAVCYLVGSFMWGMLEAWKEDKAKGRNRGIRELIRASDAVPSPSTRGELNTSNHAKTTISVRNAINGRIIEIGTHTPNMHGPDWTFEHFILAEGEPLEPAISTILLMKGMK
jgi:hypothetical protein